MGVGHSRGTNGGDPCRDSGAMPAREEGGGPLRTHRPCGWSNAGEVQTPTSWVAAGIAAVGLLAASAAIRDVTLSLAVDTARLRCDAPIAPGMPGESTVVAGGPEPGGRGDRRLRWLLLEIASRITEPQVLMLNMTQDEIFPAEAIRHSVDFVNKCTA